MTTAKERLEQLARTGHRRAAAGRRALLAAAGASTPSDEQRIRACVMARDHFDAWGMGAALGLALAAALFVIVEKGIGPDEGQVVAAVFLAVGGSVFMAVRWLVALGAPERERRRIAHLGFRVEGWFDVMCLAEPENGRLQIAVHFLRDGPGEATLQALMARVGAERIPGQGAFKGPFVVARKTPMHTASAVAFVRFQSELLNRVLLPLHAQHTLSRITLSRLPPADHAP